MPGSCNTRVLSLAALPQCTHNTLCLQHSLALILPQLRGHAHEQVCLQSLGHRAPGAWGAGTCSMHGFSPQAVVGQLTGPRYSASVTLKHALSLPAPHTPHTRPVTSNPSLAVTLHIKAQGWMLVHHWLAVGSLQ